METIHSKPFKVEPFDRDRMGNISGYRVVRRGWMFTGNPHRADGMTFETEVAGPFCGDIYRPGSLEEARAKAHGLAAERNGRQ